MHYDGNDAGNNPNGASGIVDASLVFGNTTDANDGNGGGNSGSGGADHSGGDNPAPYGYFANGKARKSPRRGGNERVAQPRAQASYPRIANTEMLAGMLASIHQMAAGMLGDEMFALDKQEAKELAASANTVMEMYGGQADPRMLAVVQLGTVCGAIYIPRILRLLNKPKEQTK